MYWQCVLLGCAVAGALYVYFRSNGEVNAGHRHQENGNERRNHPRPRNTTLPRASKPNDKCFWCAARMPKSDFYLLRCKHALHNVCFIEFLRLDKKCLICQSADKCVICHNDEDPLTEENSTLLACQQHYLHTRCLEKYKEAGFRNCPLCRKDL